MKKRCRWLLTFAEGELAELPGRPDDPFSGQRIDGNTLGMPPARLPQVPRSQQSLNHQEARNGVHNVLCLPEDISALISPKHDKADVCASVSGWALAMSTSRAFRVRGADQPAAQLPLIDMCNHSFAPNCQVQVKYISGSHLPGLWPKPWQQGCMSMSHALQDLLLCP